MKQATQIKNEATEKRESVASACTNNILKNVQSNNYSKDYIDEQLKLYILAKFDLLELADTLKCNCDFDKLTQKSIDKAFKLNPKLAKESLRSATCDGASTLDTKQALLMMAIQNDFNVKLDTMKAALAENISELADVLIEAIKKCTGKNCAVAVMHNENSQDKVAASKKQNLSCFDYEALRLQFRALQQEINGHSLVYLDNAASMQMPQEVIQSITKLRQGNYSNVHRGTHKLSQLCSDAFDSARMQVAKFLDVKAEELIFTYGTSDGLNKAARMLNNRLGKNSNIVITEMEHHSNLLPWMNLAKEKSCELRIIPVLEDGTLSIESANEIIDENTAILSFTQLSNVSGISIPHQKLTSIARKKSDAIIIIDGAQGAVHACHKPKELDCDMYAFSGHKLGSLAGVGALWVKSELLKTLQPCTFGGGTVEDVTTSSFILRNGIERFEPGTPPIDGAISLAAAINFWTSMDEDSRINHEQKLMDKIQSGLEEIPKIKIFGRSSERIGAISFVVDGMSSYKCAQILDSYGIAVRSGRHCAQPYLNSLGFDSTVRASIACYNSFEDIDKFLNVLISICKN